MSQKTEKPKKILFIITKSNWGGAQKYVYHLATSLPENYRVSVAVGGDGALKEKLRDKGIRVISLPWLGRDINPVMDLLVFKKLVALLKNEHPDVIHLNSSKIGGLGALAGRIAKVPKIIFTAHGWAFREDRPAAQKAAIKFLSWLTILFSHKVITVSKRDQDEALSMPFSRDKIVLVNNGTEAPEFLQKEEARRRIMEKCAFSSFAKKDPFWIGTIGELHKNKGQMFAIEALAALPAEAFFVIIGEGEERKTLEESIRKFGLRERVFLPGKIEDAASYLTAFDLFVFPSVKEGLPYAILEAGLAGLPVIASAVGGIPEMIQDMESGILVRPKSPDEIVKAFNYLLSHPEKMKAFGKKLHTRISRDFSFKQMAAKTMEVYKK